MATVTTPWGKATTVEEVSVAQRARDKRFTTRVQLLETQSGERLVRFAYASDANGSARRGPVTLRERDLVKLGVALAQTEELRLALGEVGMDRPT
jgi:hypothetical protein